MTTSNAKFLLLLAVLLPPQTLEMLGPVVEERRVETPYGTIGPLALRRSPVGVEVWVQPYTGSPTRTDPRATVYAARDLGVSKILNWDGAVAINPTLMYGQAAVVTDFIDWTKQQVVTFSASESGVDLRSQPPVFCPKMCDTLRQMIPYAPPVTYLGFDVPRRETAAEATMFRAWGADVLGYNMVPEVILVNELGIDYAGLVTIDSQSSDQRNRLHFSEFRSTLELTARALPAFFERAADL